MSKTSIRPEEDVLEMLSIGDDYDINMTHEEESILLQDNEDMNVENHNTSRPSDRRQKIIFDLPNNKTIADKEDNDSQDMSDSYIRFGSEKPNSMTGNTICLSLSESNRRAIPDSLDDMKCNQLMDWKRNRHRNRSRSRRRSRTRISGNQYMNGVNDLREVIGNKSGDRFANQLNRNLLSNEYLNVSQLNNALHLQLLLNANPLLAQNSLMNTNSLLALGQMQNNPLFSNNSSIFQSNRLNRIKKTADKPQITITIDNTPKPSSTKTSTKSNINCVVDKIGSQDDSQHEMQLNENKAENDTQLRLKTKFAKHVINKSIDGKQKSETVPKAPNRFADALAEVEVGVDNEYLQKMEEMKKLRLEIQKQKEERRLEMADQRWEDANELQQKLRANNKTFSLRGRHTPY